MTGKRILLSVSDLKIHGSDQVFILGHWSIIPLYKDMDTKLKLVMFLSQSTYACSTDDLHR